MADGLQPASAYDILQTKLIDFPMMQRLRRFARYWDLVGNSGNFVETTPWLWREQPSPFAAFLAWSGWLHAQTGRTDSIALARLMELLFTYLTTKLQLSPAAVAEVLWRDYQRGGRRDAPGFLRPHLPEAQSRSAAPTKGIPKRQARHVVAGR